MRGKRLSVDGVEPGATDELTNGISLEDQTVRRSHRVSVGVQGNGA